MIRNQKFKATALQKFWDTTQVHGRKDLKRMEKQKVPYRDVPIVYTVKRLVE